MTQGNGQQTLETFFAAFREQDLAAMEALLAPDFVIHEVDGLPYGGVYKGYAGWMELLARIGATWEGLAPTVRHLVGDGRHFAVLMDLTLTAKATGRTLDTSIFEMWTVEDGKIKEVRPFYWDTRAVADLAA
jgi:ketosteroid isomerase-like protein